MNQTFLFAPPEYWKLTDDERKNFRCGPGRGVLEFLVPEKIWGLCITPACAIHDFMYREGPPTPEGKAEADAVFLNNTIRLIEAGTDPHYRLLMRLRLRRARTYYESVKLMGGAAYWKGKNKPGEMGLVRA